MVDRLKLVKLAKSLKSQGEGEAGEALEALLNEESPADDNLGDLESDSDEPKEGLSEKEMRLLGTRLKSEINSRSAA